MTTNELIKEGVKGAFTRFKEKDFQKTDAPNTLKWLGRGDTCRANLDELGNAGGQISLRLKKGRIGHVIDTGGLLITKPDEEILSVFKKFGVTAIFDFDDEATNDSLRAVYRATPPEVTASGLEDIPKIVNSLKEFGKIERAILLGIEWQEKDINRMENLAAKLEGRSEISTLKVDFTPDKHWTVRSYSFLIKRDKYAVMTGTLRGRSHRVASGRLAGKPRSFLRNVMSFVHQ
jgi:hypothetical protein